MEDCTDMSHHMVKIRKQEKGLEGARMMMGRRKGREGKAEQEKRW